MGAEWEINNGKCWLGVAGHYETSCVCDGKNGAQRCLKGKQVELDSSLFRLHRVCYWVCPLFSSCHAIRDIRAICSLVMLAVNARGSCQDWREGSWKDSSAWLPPCRLWIWPEEGC